MFESVYETKHKKKIALIGPAIDRLASHVRWGSRLSSSFYRTVGLNVSLRTVTKTTETTKASFDFVIWQFSPTLSPSLLKSLIRGASALIVACYSTSDQEQITANANTSENIFVEETIGDAELVGQVGLGQELDIAMIEKSANQLKLPIAFIHFVEDESAIQAFSRTENSELQNKQKETYTNGELLKLGQTEHSLHLGITSDQDCEYCLGQAFDYIAGHFASAA